MFNILILTTLCLISLSLKYFCIYLILRNISCVWHKRRTPSNVARTWGAAPGERAKFKNKNNGYHTPLRLRLRLSGNLLTLCPRTILLMLIISILSCCIQYFRYQPKLVSVPARLCSIAAFFSDNASPELQLDRWRRTVCHRLCYVFSQGCYVFSQGCYVFS